MRMISTMIAMRAWLSYRTSGAVWQGLFLLLLSSSAAAEETRWMYCYYNSDGVWYYTLPFRKYTGWDDDIQKSYYVRGEGPAYSWDSGNSGRTEAEAMALRERSVEHKRQQGIEVAEWDWRADLDKTPATKTLTAKAVGGIIIKDPNRVAEPYEELAARQLRVQRENAQRRIAARAEGIRENVQIKAKIAALLAERRKRYPAQ